MNRPSEVEFLIKRYLEGAYGVGTNEAILLMYILDSEKSRMTEQKARELVDWYKFRNLERGYVLFDFDVVRLLTEHGRGDDWISVKERIPERVEAIAIGYQGEMLIGYIAEQKGEEGHFVCETEGVRLERVTHWMPLPAPPAIEKGE